MIGWLADPLSWGPLTRAVAVLWACDGVVLSQRDGARQWAPLDAEGIPHLRAGCCGGESMEASLASLQADLLVADPVWWDVARADGRPVITLGKHSHPDCDWNVDELPLHPWAYGLTRTRAEVRSEWGVPDSTPVVACMSPTHMRNTMENTVKDSLPPGALLVSLQKWGDAPKMVGADLIVTSAGWASSVEARWSGVPHCLLGLGAPDQPTRVTHSRSEAAALVAHVEPANLPDDWVAAPDAGPLLGFIGLMRGKPLRALG